MKESAFASRRLVHALAGVGFVHVDSKNKEHYTTYQLELKYVLLLVYEIHNE